MGMALQFVNELEIKMHLVLLRRFKCGECERLLQRGERYWEVSHYATPSAFDNEHMHVLCTTCAPDIAKAEKIFIGYLGEFQECDFYRFHVNRIIQMLKSGSPYPAASRSGSDHGSLPSAETCPDCGKSMELHDDTLSCFACDYHRTDTRCEKMDRTLKSLDMESLKEFMDKHRLKSVTF